MLRTRNQLRTGLTVKEEMFAQRYSGHGNATRAYMQVFSKKIKEPQGWHRTEAKRLLAKGAMQARIRELHDASEAGALIDHFRLVRMYVDAYDMAAEQGNPIGMVAATTSLAKLGGFMSDGNIPPKPVENREDLITRINDRARRLGLPLIPMHAPG